MVNKTSRYNIRVIDRTINVLKLLSDGTPRTLTDISREISISSSTVFRILASLANYNFIQKDDLTDEYTLGLACLELASTFLDSIDIRQQARPELKKLRDLTSETVHLGILDQMEVVYLDKFHSLHAIGMMSSHIGGRAPAYCTGLGKVMLAYQDQDIVRAHYQENGMIEYTGKTITDVEALMKHLVQIRSQGFSKDDGEHENDVRCLAVQIYDFSGSVVAAISLSGPSERLNSIGENKQLTRWIQEAGAEISNKMGYIPKKGQS